MDKPAITAELYVRKVMSAERKNVSKKYFIVYGDIKNDTRKKFPDGADVYTSPVCSLDRENNLVITYYSTYQVTAACMDFIEKQVLEGGFKFYPKSKRK